MEVYELSTTARRPNCSGARSETYPKVPAKSESAIFRFFAAGGAGPTNLFAVTFAGDWRRLLSEVIASVERLSTDLQTHFGLDQNCPNPFNPATVISTVTLKIYDLLGGELATLVKEVQSAGLKELQWNGKVSSGLYFYGIEAVSKSDPNERFV